jgi:hypothetical protein
LPDQDYVGRFLHKAIARCTVQKVQSSHQGYKQISNLKSRGAPVADEERVEEGRPDTEAAIEQISSNEQLWILVKRHGLTTT